jgi:hypothetical protein
MRTIATIFIVLGLLLAAAYVSGVFGPAEDRVAAATPEACYAAAVEAAAKPNPTNVPCDWKAVEAASPGAALNGRYEAATAGISGRLVVMEQAGKPARLAFSTAGESPRYICTAALEAIRENDKLVARPAEVTGCEITLVSSATPDVVTVTSTAACNALCNMRGSLSGDFRLMPH